MVDGHVPWGVPSWRFSPISISDPICQQVDDQYVYFLASTGYDLVASSSEIINLLSIRGGVILDVAANIKA